MPKLTTWIRIFAVATFLAAVLIFVFFQFVVPRFAIKNSNRTFDAMNASTISCPEGTERMVHRWGFDGWSQGCETGEIRHGPWEAWENARLSISGAYDQGKKSGTWQWFSEDGTVTRLRTYPDEPTRDGNDKKKEGISIHSCLLAERDLDLEFEMNFEEKKKVYLWMGHMYPILDRILHVDVRNPEGEEIAVQRRRKPMPKVPHEQDFVEGRTIRPEHPLELEIVDGLAPVSVEVRIEYSTTGASALYDHLSDVTVTSKWTACPPVPRPLRDES